MTAKKNISPEMSLKEVLQNPRARKVLLKYGISCFDCGGMGKEKLGHAAQCHGIKVEDIIEEIIQPESTKR